MNKSLELDVRFSLRRCKQTKLAEVEVSFGERQELSFMGKRVAVGHKY